MGKYLLICFILFLPARMLFTQEKEPVKTWSSRIYLFSGYRNINFDNLNAELLNNNFQSFENDNFSLGLLSTVIINDRFIFGFEGQTISKQSYSSSLYQTSMGSFMGLFNLGVQFVNSSGFTIFTLIGGGIGTVQLKNYDLNPMSFTGILSNPRQGFELNYATGLFSVSAGADYLINLSKGKDKGGFLIGVRAGYIIDPFEGAWDMNYVKISNGVHLDLSGFYILVMFGGGIQSY